MSLFRDTALSAISSVSSTGARLLITVLLARRLAPETYGQYVFLQWLIDFLNFFSSFGLAGVMIRFLPPIIAAPRGRSVTPIRMLFSLLAISVALSVTLFLGYLFVAGNVTEETWVLISWCIASASVSFLYSGLQGLFRYDAVAAGNLTFAVSAPLLFLYLLQSPSVTHAALAMTLGLITSACAAVARCAFVSRKVKGRESELPSRRTLITYGTNLWLIGLLSALVWYRGEFGILKLYVGNGEIARYSAAISLSGAITQAAALLTGALVPHLSLHWRSGDNERIERILRRVTQATLMCATAIAIGLIGCGRIIIALVFGVAYTNSYSVLCILAIAAISIGCGCANTALQIETDARFDRNANVIGLILLLTVSFTMTPYFGIVGAAVGRAVAQIAIGLYTFWTLGAIEALRASARRFMAAFLFSIGIGSFYFFAISRWEPGIVASVAVTSAYAAGALVAIRFAIGEKLTWAAD